MASGLSSTKAMWPARFLPYIGVLVASKFFRSFGLFLSYDLLKLIHVVQFLFLIKVGSSAFFIVLQKPFSSGKRISKHQWFRITRHAFLGSLIQVLWLFGLTLCGPLRTLMLFEHSDIALIAGISALFNSVGGPAKFRGGVFFVLGILGVLLFDHDGVHAPDHHDGQPDGSHHSSIITHLFYHITNLTGLSDHKGGVVLLVATLCLQVGYNSAAKKLSVDIGGSKRLNALSTFVSTLLLCPWALFLFSTTQSAVESWPWLLFPMILVILSVFVIDYYVESVCNTHMDMALTGRVATMSILVCSMFISGIWNHPFVSSLTTMQFAQDVIAEDHILSGGVVFSFVIFLFATHILTSEIKTTHKGSLIGYSAAGLPLYNFNGDAFHRTSHSVLMVAKNGLRQILEESDSRRIFYFLCVNLSFTFIELVYGAWTNSLGLISDGFHMLFDCSALVMGLYAAIMSRWKATRIFSYGYDRVEILSGFINALFLLVIAFFVFMAALTRVFDPPEIKTERLLTVSVAGLVVNLFGIMAFRHTHSHGGLSHGHSHGGHGHSHSHGHSHGAHGNSHSTAPKNHGHSHSVTQNTNMQGVFLHVLADTLGSVGVIISTLLIENFSLKIADPICSLFIAILIALSVMPLVKETSLVLLLRTPDESLEQLQGALLKVLSIEGVLSYRDEHCWKHSSSVVCGTIHVQVQPDVNEQKIVTQVTSIFKEIGVTNMTVQVEKQTFFQHISGLGVSIDQVMEMTKNLKALNYDNSTVFIKAI